MTTYNDGVPATPSVESHYGTLAGGDSYFSRRLNSASWEESTDSDKTKSLYEATALIDRLNFKGVKTDPTQELEFPRGGDTDVPTNIEYATYELAIALLSGKTIEDNQTNVKRRKFGNQVETEYDPRILVASNLYAGIISKMAWSYLAPYLRNVTEVELVRVS